MTRRLNFKRHRFPPDVIRQAVWLYFSIHLSLRDVEEMLAQRGIDVTYESIRCWTVKFGPLIARNLKRRRIAPSPRWHLDEMVCRVGGKQMYLWRAVDDEGEVLDLVMQKKRDTGAALRLLKALLHNQPVAPQSITTDGLRSYAAALDQLGLRPHLPIRRRERKMQLFKSRRSAQQFLTTHAGIYNTFYAQQHLIRRPMLRAFRAAAFRSWEVASA